MIPNGEGWDYLAVKKQSALLRGMASKDNGDFYFLNCFHSFLEQKTNLKANIHNHFKRAIFK